MDLSFLFDFFLHLDRYLGILMGEYGTAVYALLFAVVFCETGLVVTPLLPGDSLIFAAGALTAAGIMNWYALPLFMAAAVFGNMLNYRIGRSLSEKVSRGGGLRFVKQEYLDRTQKFFDRHGGATIIITRFMPILRTFSPFVAGLGKMPYRRFLLFNTVGGLSWASAFFLIGYFFGNLPVVKAHFSMIVIGIVAVSVIPAIIVAIKGKRAAKESGAKQETAEGNGPENA